MSDYSKATNFTSKDTLPTGNSGKIVKGTELDTEFTAIASAISSKADVSSPNLLGTPTSTTATTGSNTTQIATTAFVKNTVDALSLGNMSTQAKTAVDITGGTIVGITDLAVADGGTGRSTLTANAVLTGNGTSGINSVSPGTSGNVLKSNGTAWTSAALSISGLGLNGETWRTTSNALNTSYTNSYGYPIMVAVTTTSGSGTYISAVVGGVTIQTNGTHAATELNTLTFIVPTGATYQVTAVGESLNIWAELR
jgi:hypothetical protein